MKSNAGTSHGTFSFQRSLSTVGGSDTSRASMILDGNVDDETPIQIEVQEHPVHRRVSLCPDRIDLTWMNYDKAYNKFDRLHRILIPKYEAKNAIQGPNPNPQFTYQLLKGEVEAMNVAWREMLFAYDALAKMEREDWSEESLCMDVDPYLKSFAQFLEWEYKLIRGWELPWRYRGGGAGAGHGNGGGGEKGRAMEVQAEVEAAQYAHQKEKERLQRGREHEQQGHPPKRPSREEVPDDDEVTTPMQADYPMVERDGNTDDGEDDGMEGEEQTEWLNMTTAADATPRNTQPRPDYKAHVSSPPAPLLKPNHGVPTTHTDSKPKSNTPLLKHTLVQAVGGKAYDKGGKTLVISGSQIMSHGLSLTKEALSQSFLEKKRA